MEPVQKNKRQHPGDPIPKLVLGVVLFAMGGLNLLLWGICLRVVVGHHGTWLVKSGTHMWGTRRSQRVWVNTATGKEPPLDDQVR